MTAHTKRLRTQYPQVKGNTHISLMHDEYINSIVICANDSHLSPFACGVEKITQYAKELREEITRAEQEAIKLHKQCSNNYGKEDKIKQ